MKCRSVRFIAIAVTALLATAGCTALRAVRAGMPSSDNYIQFATDTVRASGSGADTLVVDTDTLLAKKRFDMRNIAGQTLDEFFGRSKGDRALIVLRGDTVVMEHYYGSMERGTLTSVYSVSKALTALLCGIAIDEGLIGSVDDTVTRYIPELSDADPMFRQLTLAHLLDMRTGLSFEDDYGWNPFSKMASLYYGEDVMKEIGKARFREAPGQSFHYNSLATAILGVVIERATGQPFARYLEEKVWKPMGMESDALVALDSRQNGHAKAYGGIYATARDMARIGALYNNGGTWRGLRIVSREWIDRTTHPSLDNAAYSRGWMNMTAFDSSGRQYVYDRFFARGLFGQMIFCDPAQRLVFVTLGSDKTAEYSLVFDDVCYQLQR